MIAGVVLTTLRLHRAQIVATVLLVAAVVAVTVITGTQADSNIQQYLQDDCTPELCAPLLAQARQSYPLFIDVLPLLALMPVVIGAFWGAPLLGREYETGTAKFVWTQSISRRTWVLGRMAVLAVIIACCAVGMGLAVDYWISVFDPLQAASDFSFGQARRLSPLGWWLFAFTIGVFCGAALRRTVPAMAITAALLIVATIGRNVSFGLITEDEPVSAAVSLQHLEVAILIGLSLLLTALTGWIVQHSRA